MRLTRDFLELPIAHRGLHDARQDRPENSLAAIRAAIHAGYAIEIDVQATADNEPVVFHDRNMLRLTGRNSLIRNCSLCDVTATVLSDSDEFIPDFAGVLDIVDGRVPLLVEIKDRNRRFGQINRKFGDRVCGLIGDYPGPVAAMSFHPDIISEFCRQGLDIPLGLVTCSFKRDSWPGLASEKRQALEEITDFDNRNMSFISHDWRDLRSEQVSRVRRSGADVLCWTVRSEEEEFAARKLSMNFTFENYMPKFRGSDFSG